LAFPTRKFDLGRGFDHRLYQCVVFHGAGWRDGLPVPRQRRHDTELLAAEVGATGSVVSITDIVEGHPLRFYRVIEK